MFLHRRRWFIVACSWVMTSAIAIRTEASTLVAYEGFDYPSGLTTSSNGGQGWSGPWYQNSNLTGEPTASVFGPGSMRFPSGVTFEPTGNRIGTALGFPNNVGFRQLATDARIDLGTDSVRYLSFIYAGNPSQWGGLSLWDSAGVEQVFFGVIANQFFLAGLLGGDNRGGVAPSGQDLFITAKVVSRASGNDEVYLQPYLQTDTVPSTEPSSWLISKTDISSSLTLDRIRIASAQGYSLDEIRVGTSWEAAVVGVPEPSTWMLIASAAGALPFAYRRRLATAK